MVSLNSITPVRLNMQSSNILWSVCRVCQDVSFRTELFIHCICLAAHHLTKTLQGHASVTRIPNYFISCLTCHDVLTVFPCWPVSNPSLPVLQVQECVHQWEAICKWCQDLTWCVPLDQWWCLYDRAWCGQTDRTPGAPRPRREPSGAPQPRREASGGLRHEHSPPDPGGISLCHSSRLFWVFGDICVPEPGTIIIFRVSTPSPPP